MSVQKGVDIELQEMQEELEDDQDGKFLTFTLGEEEYGIDIRFVTEIVGIQKITDLPDDRNLNAHDWIDCQLSASFSRPPLHSVEILSTITSSISSCSVIKPPP